MYSVTFFLKTSMHIVEISIAFQFSGTENFESSLSCLLLVSFIFIVSWFINFPVEPSS